MKRICSRLMLWPVILLIFSGCSSELDQLKEQNFAGLTQAQAEITKLKKHLNGDLIRNANLLEIYARVVGNMNKQVEPLAEALAEDATSDGPMVRSLEARLQNAQQQFKSDLQLQQATALNDEINNLVLAANPDLYGLMLTDPINVLADMSNGELGRVEAMSKEASLKVNKAGDNGAGSQLVGNPNYGQWQTNSSGNSLWAWYGQYAFFSTMFGRPTYYGGWSGRRDYSYYHDYGRNQYSSPAQRQTQQKVEQRTKKSFSQSGKKFQSPYAKQKSGSSSVRAKTSSIKKSAASKSFNSGYAKSSSRSGNNSSSRTSSYSRSSRRSGSK